MPVNAIDWSCSNESKDMLTNTKKKVEQCADHSQATCIATLTQESLAKPLFHQQGQEQPIAEYSGQCSSHHVLLRRRALESGEN